MITWTLEEESILNIYNHGSRLSTLSTIEEVLPYLDDEPDMRQIMKNTIEKLEQTSDIDPMPLCGKGEKCVNATTNYISG